MNQKNQAVLEALSMVDLTRLEEDDSQQAIETLCQRAHTPHGAVAAVCIHPRFVAAARRILDAAPGSGCVRLATVANFPAGEASPADVVEQVIEALDHGADEIDLVFPWRHLQSGNAEAGHDLLSTVRRTCGDHVLKIILETGELSTPGLIRRAATIAIDEGADFLKTSTGKVPVNATPEAARLLLETIRASGRDVGCKVSGGIRATEQAIQYLELAETIMGPGWLSPKRFRFGASGLLDQLIATLDGTKAPFDSDTGRN